MQGLVSDELAGLCRHVISENDKAVSDYRKGKDKAVKALVGAVMRASRGRADPVAAEDILRRMLE
ncbi:MAG: hypothetical protein IJ072_01175 [Oscillospiraceae bacterium]|nr:hypothetical protein [Oscillospiraceae bacterium]